MAGRKLPIPREHGVYVVMAGSWILGLVYTSRPDFLTALSLLLAGLACIVLTGAIRELLRSARSPALARHRDTYRLWTWATAGVLVATMIPPFVARPALLWFALPGAAVAIAYFRVRKLKRALILQSLVAFVGVSLLAPAVYYASSSRGTLQESVVVWLIALLFFCGSVLAVNIRLAGKRMLLPAGIYFLTSLAVAGVLLHYQLIPIAGVIGIALGAGRYGIVAAGVEAYRSMTLKAVGIGETALTVAFLIVNAIG